MFYKEENLKINVVLIIVMDLTVMEMGLVVTLGSWNVETEMREKRKSSNDKHLSET